MPQPNSHGRARVVLSLALAASFAVLTACSKPAPLCVCADNSASLAEALRNIMMSRRDQVGGAGGGMVVPVAHSIC